MFKQSLRLIRRRSGWPICELNVTKVRCMSCEKMLFSEKKDAPFLKNPLFSNVGPIALNFRNYAKNRDIKKEKKKKIKIDKNELQEYLDFDKLLMDLEKPLERFKEELVKHTTLRSSAGAIENIKIHFEGNVYTIQDLAEIGKKNPRLYVLDFDAFPAAIPKVVDILQNSELNVNVQQEGTKVYVPVPKVTKAHREVLAKKSKLYFFKCKEAIREIQMKYIKSLSKIEKLPIEDRNRVTEQLTALGDKQILAAEDILKEKHNELLKEDEVIQS